MKKTNRLLELGYLNFFLFYFLHFDGRTIADKRELPTVMNFLPSCDKWNFLFCSKRIHVHMFWQTDFKKIFFYKELKNEYIYMRNISRNENQNICHLDFHLKCSLWNYKKNIFYWSTFIKFTTRKYTFCFLFKNMFKIL